MSIKEAVKDILLKEWVYAILVILWGTLVVYLIPYSRIGSLVLAYFGIFAIMAVALILLVLIIYTRRRSASISALTEKISFISRLESN